MLCTGCHTHAAVLGQFCGNCDMRARNGTFERRRPTGGSQWQALWGINYTHAAGQRNRRRWVQGSVALTGIALAVLLAYQ